MCLCVYVVGLLTDPYFPCTQIHQINLAQILHHNNAMFETTPFSYPSWAD